MSSQVYASWNWPTAAGVFAIHFPTEAHTFPKVCRHGSSMCCTWLHFIFNYNMSDAGTFRLNRWVKGEQFPLKPQITANLVIWLESKRPVNTNPRSDSDPLIARWSKIAYHFIFWHQADHESIRRWSKDTRVTSCRCLCGTCARVLSFHLIKSRMWLCVPLDAKTKQLSHKWFWLLTPCHKSSSWRWAATPWPPSEITSEALSGRDPPNLHRCPHSFLPPRRRPSLIPPLLLIKAARG